MQIDMIDPDVSLEGDQVITKCKMTPAHNLQWGSLPAAVEAIKRLKDEKPKGMSSGDYEKIQQWWIGK